MIWCLGHNTGYPLAWLGCSSSSIHPFMMSDLFVLLATQNIPFFLSFISAGCQSVTNVEWKNNIYKQFIVLGRKKSSSVGVKTWSRSVTQLIVTPRDSTQNDNSRSTINKRSRSQAGDEKPAKIVPFMAKKAAQEEPISRLNWNHVLISWLSAQITS